MVGSYQEFAAEHRGEHLTAINRWSCVIGNYSTVPTAIALLSGRRRVAAAIFGLGSTVLVAGHLAEGNLPRSLSMLATHPIWAARADFAVANATVMGLVRRK
ncbi:MAG: hypothetical protein QOF31_1558 [Mycobacterium sp.]|jgi:hypothetical protein|nr:hypothetical protein [Mycobacterium sp.]